MHRVWNKILAATLLCWIPLSCGTAQTQETDGGASPTGETQASKEGTMPEKGDKAPDFTLKDEKGNAVTLSDFQGKQNVVLIFYPKDQTPGCTKQLCAVRDDWSAFEEQNVAVFGVNPGSAKSHQAFIDKFSFPFPLLVDADKEVARAYDCDGLLMTKRTVFGINKEGIVVFAERGMPDNAEILAAFQE